MVEGSGSWLRDSEGASTSTSCRAGRSTAWATASPSSSRRCAPGGAAHQLQPRLLQRAHGAAGDAGRRVERARSGVPLQQRRGGQRGRHQAGAQVGPALPRRRLRDRDHARRLPRPHAGDHVGLRQAGLRAALRAEGAGLPQGAAERPRRHRGGHHRAHRRRDAGADPGRGRRDRRRPTTICADCARSRASAACC